MSDYKDAITALDAAEKSLVEQLEKIRAAKSALGNGVAKVVAPVKKHKPRKVGHRFRLKCQNPLCKKGFLGKTTKGMYCSNKCGSEMFEIRTKRFAKYQPGGSKYVAEPVPPASPTIGQGNRRNKPAILLKGDSLKAGN